jgi:hypothetical protein
VALGHPESYLSLKRLASSQKKGPSGLPGDLAETRSKVLKSNKRRVSLALSARLRNPVSQLFERFSAPEFAAVFSRWLVTAFGHRHAAGQISFVRAPSVPSETSRSIARGARVGQATSPAESMAWTISS